MELFNYVECFSYFILEADIKAKNIEATEFLEVNGTNI